MAKQASCLIGHPGEHRLTLNASSTSLCCASAQVLFARRPGGFCPETESSQPLPFGVHCAVDDQMHGAYVPDAQTARAAEHLLCDLAGCYTAAMAVVMEALHENPLSSFLGSGENMDEAMLLIPPKCGTLTESKSQHLAPKERIVIVTMVLSLAMAIVAVLHFFITPRWIRAYSIPCPTTSAHLSTLTSRASSRRRASRSRDLDLSEVVDVALDTEGEHDSIAEASSMSTATGPGLREAAAAPDPMSALIRPTPPPPQHYVEPPTSPPPPHSAARPRPQAVGVASRETQLEEVRNPEVVACESLADARGRCRAHIILLCAIGLVATFARLALSAFTMPPGPLMVTVLVSCVLQLGILARASWKPLLTPPSSEDATADGGTTNRKCGDIIGDLRIYSGGTLACEILVLVIAAAGSTTGDGAEGDNADGDNSEFSRVLQAWGSFVLQQAALSLILIRIYTVWLAHWLHKLRIELTFVVLPTSLKAKKGALDSQLALTALAPAWEPCESLPDPSNDVPEAPEAERSARCMKKSRLRAIVCAGSAIALVVSAAAVGIWRSHEHSLFEQASSCHTAEQGTDFCVPVSYLGLFDEVRNQEDCCLSCDVTIDCHAWSFQADKNTGGRCWKMRFEEAPCKDLPSHPDCRCHTESGRVVGYRPEGATALRS